MSERKVAENWKLEETGDTSEKWRLEETEQNRISQWQLQGDADRVNEWRPVQYARPPEQTGSWILPFLVGVALVAVAAYGVWIGLNQFGLANSSIASIWPFATPAAPSTPVAVAPTPQTEATATPLPTEPPTATPTSEPTLTPTASPTPIPMVELPMITITNTLGVNARPNPSTEGEALKLLNAGESYPVVAEQDGWLQVPISATELAWVAAGFVQRSNNLVPIEMANQERAKWGLAPLTSEVAVAPDVPSPNSALPITGTADVTFTATVTAVPDIPITSTPSISNTAPVTDTTVVTTPVLAPVPPVGPITATVNITAGLNARTTPSTTGELVTLLPNQTTLAVLGKSEDGQWVQVRLPNGVVAWVFAQFLQLSTDISAVPPAGAVVPGTLITPTTSTSAIVSVGTAITSTAPTTPTTPTDDGQTGLQGPTATVTTLSGANARQSPQKEASSATIIPFDAVLKVTGRNAAGDWLQVELEQGQLLWVLVSTVNVSVDVATLKVVE